MTRAQAKLEAIRRWGKGSQASDILFTVMVCGPGGWGGAKIFGKGLTYEEAFEDAVRRVFERRD